MFHNERMLRRSSVHNAMIIVFDGCFLSNKKSTLIISNIRSERIKKTSGTELLWFCAKDNERDLDDEKIRTV